MSAARPFCGWQPLYFGGWPGQILKADRIARALQTRATLRKVSLQLAWAGRRMDDPNGLLAASRLCRARPYAGPVVVMGAGADD